MADWGTVPEWLAAAGTILAFGLTYGLLRHEIQLSRATKNEKRQEPGFEGQRLVLERG